MWLRGTVSYMPLFFSLCYFSFWKSFQRNKRKYHFKGINSAIRREYSTRYIWSFRTSLVFQCNMSLFDNRYYFLNKRFLSVLGLWPFQSRLEAYLMFAVTSLFIFSLTALEVLKDTHNGDTLGSRLTICFLFSAALGLSSWDNGSEHHHGKRVAVID